MIKLDIFLSLSDVSFLGRTCQCFVWRNSFLSPGWSRSRYLWPRWPSPNNVLACLNLNSHRQLIRFLDVCSIMGWVRLQLYLDTASPKLRCSGDNVCPSAPFRKGGGMQIFDHSVFVRRSYCNGKSDFITRLKTRNGKVFSKFSCVQAREIGNPSVLKRGIFFSWASLMRRKIVANWEGGQRSLSRLSIC